MPGKDQVDAPSRRRVLAGAAGAGAAGVAATMLSGLGGAQAAERDHAAADEAESGADGHVVAHVRNARTGEIDVFRGTSEVRLHDTDLAARIIRASSAR